MEKIEKIKWDNVYRVDIVSGEGSGTGTIEHYVGVWTTGALRGRLTRERCGGDRWAFALVYLLDCADPVRFDR